MAYNKVSDRVLDDCEVTIQFDQEFSGFFNDLKTEDPSRYAEMTNIAENIELSPDTTCLVLIPCYIHEDQLIRSLQSFSSQKKRDFEIIIFLNAGPETIAKDFEEKRQQFEDQIAKVSQENNLKVHVFDHHFNKKPVMGDLRATLAEVACLSSKKVGIDDPILINNDADTVYVHPDYIGMYERAFQENRRIDYATGPVDWDAEYANPAALSKKVPELLMEQRINQLALIFLRKFYEAKAHYPANLAVRASSYMASGGFDKTVSCFEDAALTGRILGMRSDLMYGQPAYGRDITTKARISTSARRSLATILEEQNMFDQWKTFDTKTYHSRSEAELVADYEANEGLVQVDDIREALNGDKKSIEKIIKRLESILVKEIINHGLLSKPTVLFNMLRFLGLRLKGVRQQEDFGVVLATYKDASGQIQVEGLEIDLDRSDRALKYLGRFFD